MSWLLSAGRYTKTKVTFEMGSETFQLSGKIVHDPGFVAVLPWTNVEEQEVPPFEVGERVAVDEVLLREGEVRALVSLLCSRVPRG